VSHAALKLTAICIAALALLGGVAVAGALVEVDGIVLRADGGFQPRTLPRRSYAPIEFKGHVNISAQNGGRPLPLQQAVIEFDHDGRLSTAGLPTCPAERVAAAGTDEARRLCQGAIVGTGTIEVLATIGGTLVPGKADLTVFNAPLVEGHPAVLLHARTTTPNEQTYAILAPIERRRGQFRYRVTIDLPPIAGGNGAITHIDAKIGRRYRAGGKLRSYVSARCSDSVLSTRGRFVFEGGLLIEGGVQKFCRQQ
jgi:hypothetical protein